MVLARKAMLGVDLKIVSNLGADYDFDTTLPATWPEAAAPSSQPQTQVCVGHLAGRAANGSIHDRHFVAMLAEAPADSASSPSRAPSSGASSADAASSEGLVWEIRRSEAFLRAVKKEVHERSVSFGAGASGAAFVSSNELHTRVTAQLEKRWRKEGREVWTRVLRRTGPGRRLDGGSSGGGGAAAGTSGGDSTAGSASFPPGLGDHGNLGDLEDGDCCPAHLIPLHIHHLSPCACATKCRPQ